MLFPHRTKKFSKRREEGMADFIYRIILARISHHPSTATAQWHVLLDFRSVGLLNIVLTMPARPSVAKVKHAAPLNRLATNSGEKCGLDSSAVTFQIFLQRVFSVDCRFGCYQIFYQVELVFLSAYFYCDMLVQRSPGTHHSENYFLLFGFQFQHRQR